MDVVAYLQPEWGQPGVRYFRCVPMSATLATEACALNWRASHEPGGERLFKCRVCPVGAVHAGETAASLSPMRGASICSRCQEGTTRLIQGWLCVSCYNRELERKRGRNAKGKVPTKIPPLHARTLALVEGGVARRLSRPATLDLVELMAAALRDSSQTVAFCFNGRASMLYAQGRLW